jgi:putative Mg2+ transporter-C (MgtC) family protein
VSSLLEWDVVLKELCQLVLATVLGGAIGFEREYHGQAAGFRTNLLVSMGACLMMLLSLHMEYLFRTLGSDTTVRLDPGRIASYAIASMGFLGAGAIIKGRGSVRGLTTAASLWLVTGIGLSVGAGYYFPAAFSTCISLIVLYNVRRLKPSLPHHIYTLLTLKCSGAEKPLRTIKEVLAGYPEIEIKFINFYKNITTGTIDYRLRLYSGEHLPWGHIVESLSRIPGVNEISWEEGEVP